MSSIRGAVKGWCVDRRPAEPPCPGSAGLCRSGEKSGKSVTQRNLNSDLDFEFSRLFALDDIRRERAFPNAVEPPCHQRCKRIIYRERLWPDPNEYRIVMFQAQKCIEFMILFLTERRL